jgi:hypothetical protein
MRTKLLCILALVLCTPTLHAQTGLAGNPVNVTSLINPDCKMSPLNDKVNSVFVEGGPLVANNGKIIFYSRLGHPQNMGGENDQDIWYNTFNDSTQQWSEPVQLGAPLNNKGPNFVCELTDTGDTVLVGNEYSKSGAMKSGLSVSMRRGTVWSFPETVFIDKNYNLSDRVDFDLSRDRQVLIIAQEKVDSKGKTDLYVAFRVKGDKRYRYRAAESVNLGGVVNSFGEETSPFLSDDGRILFFASSGHNGYGELDLFVSRRLDDTWTNWSKPENLGPKINTPFDDTDFGLPSTSEFGYYARGIANDRQDIYQIDLDSFFGRSADLEKMSQDPPSALGHMNIILNTFEDDHATIRTETLADWDRIAKYMVKNKEMRVVVMTHSNKHKLRNQSLQLSQQRAGIITSYLISKGVDGKRISQLANGHDVVANVNDAVMAAQIASRVGLKFNNYGR